MPGRLPVSYPRRKYFFYFFALLGLLGGSALAAQVPLLPSGPPSVADHSPLLTADGSYLYFSRQGHERNLGRANTDDIWMLPARDGGWGTPLNAGAPINSNLSDRAIGIDVSGNRLAVVRRGNGLPYLDLLERSGRSWRIAATRLLPDAAVGGTGLVYSFRDDLLFFSAAGPAADLDVFVSFYASASGSWLAAQPLPAPLSSAADEYAFSLAPDGRTAYLLRREVGAAVRRLRAELTVTQGRVEVNGIRPLSGSITGDGPLAVAATGNKAVTGESAMDRPMRLIEFAPALADLPPAATVITGRLSATAGQRPVNNKLRLLIGGETREVFVDRYGFYTYLSPPGSAPVLLSGSPGFYLIDTENGSAPEPDYENNYELAATRFSSDYRRREQEMAGWREELSATGSERTRLQRDRRAAASTARTAELAAGRNPTTGYEDPELDGLRHRYAQANGVEIPASGRATDTLPPPTSGWTPRNGTPPVQREADVLRAKYQRAQELRRQRSNGNYEEPAGRTNYPPATAAPPPVTTYDGLPARDLGVKSPAVAPDSSGVSGSIREGLYDDRTPAYYEEAAWEKKLGSKLDTRPGGTAPAAPLNPPPAAGTPYDPPTAAPVYPAPTAAYPTSAYPQPTNSAYPPPATAPPLDQRMESAVEAQRREERQLGLGTAPLMGDVSARGVPTPTSDAVSASGRETSLLSLTGGAKVVLDNLRFAPNSAIFKSTAEAELARLTYFLQSNSEVRIEIGAHSAGRLSYDFAQRLSDARAAAVRERLIQQGIDGVRIEARGYGKRFPTDGFQRIELRVL